ncbi:MAG TPA: cellulase family glycosylhydrolase [Clostridiaceae bacterium]|nr:cellulase family glycosylhydrolase [Clostridiaceae bacterium]
MNKRILSYILLIAMVSTMTYTTPKAKGVSTILVFDNYEDSDITNGYVNKIKNSSASYISANSNIEVFTKSPLSGTKSLKIKNCDMRWWSLIIEEPEIYYSFQIRIDENYNNPLLFQIYTQHLTIPNANDTILSIIPENGHAVLKDHDANTVFEFEKNKVYDISISINRGESKYALSVNDREVGSCDFFIPIYRITGMRFLVNNNTSDSYICFDKFTLKTSGSRYPQPYSYQETGPLPDVTLPKVKKDKNFSLYINTVTINLNKSPVEKNNTLYLPLERVMECAGFDVKTSKSKIIIKNDKISAEINNGTLTLNNKTVKLNNPVIRHKGVYMASLQLFHEVLNCKIWWDEAEKTVAFTTGKYKNDDILRIINNKFYMNGEPYYEISFNKFDLCMQIAADYYYDSSYPTAEFTYAAAESALKQLNELGFKSIRIFARNNLRNDIMYSREDKEKYYEMMDKLFDLCDRYDIKIVLCLELIDNMFVKKKYVDKVGWVSDDETLYDLISDRDSVSRQNLYKYLDEFIGRYKDRKTILMWEILNEGNLHADVGASIRRVTYSLLQLSEFYTDVTEKIHDIDPERLVTGGDSALRTAQWNLFKGVMEGDLSSNWTIDTLEERLKALYLLHKGVDVLSTHTYDIDSSSDFDLYYKDATNNAVNNGYKILMEEAKRIGKVLYNGECAGCVGASWNSDPSSPGFIEGRIKYLELIIDAGVQLTHWWTFRSDRQGFNDGDTWRNDNSPLLDAIVEANKELQIRYKVNRAENANTRLVWEDYYFSVIDEDKVVPGNPINSDNNLKVICFALIPILLIAVAGGVFLVIRKKKISGSKV